MDTAINEAIENQDIEGVRAILESDDEDQVKFIDGEGIDSIAQDSYLVACRVGNVKIYEMLTTYYNDNIGRNGHLREYEQNDGTVLIRTTHLCEALRHGNAELARRLVNLGANVNAIWVTDDDSYYGDEDRFHGIVTSRSGIAWWLADKSMWPELKKHELEVDAYVDELDGTAICMAVIQGKDDVVELLLEMGADPTQKFLADRVSSFPYELGRMSLLVLAMHAYYNRPNEKKLRIVFQLMNRLPLKYLSEPMYVVPFDNPFFEYAESLTEFVLANEASPIDEIFGLKGTRQLIQVLQEDDNESDIDSSDTERHEALASNLLSHDLTVESPFFYSKNIGVGRTIVVNCTSRKNCIVSVKTTRDIGRSEAFLQSGSLRFDARDVESVLGYIESLTEKFGRKKLPVGAMIRATEIAYLRSVIDGSVQDILAEEVGKRLESIIGDYGNDAEIHPLIEAAADAYARAMLKSADHLTKLDSSLIQLVPHHSTGNIR